MVHWLKMQEVWAGIRLRNYFTSVPKYLFCLSDLKGSDREGMKGGKTAKGRLRDIHLVAFDTACHLLWLH